MMDPTYAILAFAPILLSMILLIGFRLSAKISMPIVLATTIATALAVWKMDLAVVAASSIQGLFMTMDVLYIIVGALMLLSVLKYSGGLSSIQYHFTQISPDRRIQIIILGWIFGSFIEGASGFGTPAAIVAPLLVALGFPAMSAVVIGLMVQSTSVTFGAIGTPILIGINNGLAAGAMDATQKAAFLNEVTSQIGIIHAIIGALMPWFMIVMSIFFFGEKADRKKCLTIAPFAIFSGLAFTVPYALTAVFLGPEFPSLLGPMIAMVIVITAVKYKFLLPKDSWEFPSKKKWSPDWSGKMEMPKEQSNVRPMSVVKTISPYILVSVLLVITRNREWGIGAFLKSFSISWDSIFGTKISADSTPLYLPGTILIIAAIFAFVVYKMPVVKLKKAVIESVRISLVSAFVLLFTIPMVRVYINSGLNPINMESMPVVLAEWTASKFPAIWPMLAPFIGALGAFIAGSNTVSNLMFTEFQYSIADKLGYSNVVIVALQAVGAAAGNMIAIHNVVAVAAVVGLMGKEGQFLRKSIIPTLYYLFMAGLLGLILVRI